jgi:shikimate dehydrogenase
VVLNRTIERARALVADLGGRHGWSARLSARPLTPDGLVASTDQASLLVNATTVGMWPVSGGSIWPEDVSLPSGVTVFDLVYNPLETRLLRQARSSGACAIDGLEMLVQQGALAFEMWTGQQVDRDDVADVMRTTCRKRLQA